MRTLVVCPMVMALLMGGCSGSGGGAGPGGAGAAGTTSQGGGAAAGETAGSATGGTSVVGGNTTGGTGAVGWSTAGGTSVVSGSRAGGTGAVGGSPAFGGITASGGATSSGGSTVLGGSTGTTSSPSPRLWSMGYYASWAPQQYPISEIEWSGLTHIAMAFYLPQSGGTLTLAGGDNKLATDLIKTAHANGVKAVASIGGSDSQSGFRLATSSSAMATFINNLLALLDAGYDGIDIDWEPMDKSDEPAVIDIAKRIRAVKPGALLTIPIGEINVNIPPDISGYPEIAAVYDQLNIMSYGQAGTWSGWKSWHSSALYHTDSATPTSIDSTIKLYLAAKVPAAKLGIGIGFYGLCYGSPVTAPDQALNGSTLLASDGTISYANIMGKYWSADARRWDDLAKVPYLSFATPHAPDKCTYISYDDEQSIAEKGAYVKAKGLGGVIQWELNEGYLGTAAAGQRNPLLKAIHDSFLR